MGSRDIQEKKGDSMGVTIYETPLHRRKYIGTTVTEAGDGHKLHFSFGSNVDTRFYDWLEANTLGRTGSFMPGHYHSDYTYLLMGSNGVLCAIHPDMVNDDEPGIFRSADHIYRIRATIRHQPVGRDLPKELTDILEGFEFTKVKNDSIEKTQKAVPLVG